MAARIGNGQRIFITGAAGYIGRVVTELALAQGYTVYGLSRSEGNDQTLNDLGAIPVRGDLSTLDVLRQQSSEADIVLHLAFIHDFGMDYEEVLSIDAAAVKALAEPLQGTQKPFVTTSGTALVAADPTNQETDEDAPADPKPILGRRRAERYALSFVDKSVRVSVIRLAQYVYGRDGTGFTAMLMQKAVESGESVYVGDGTNSFAAVSHVDDVAKLFLLAAQQAQAGEVFNANTASLTKLELAQAVGNAVDVPTRSVTVEELAERWGTKLLVHFFDFNNRPSNGKAIRQLGWQPKGADFATTVKGGQYREMATALKAKHAAGDKPELEVRG